MSGETILIEQLRADVKRLTAERNAAFEQGRLVGRADVAKYARAIGEIESVVGIVGAVPMPQTVQAVRDLVSRAEKAERERDEWKAKHDTLADVSRSCIATAERERDEARANYAFMVKRAADQKLDGYRELGARAAAAEERAERAERERDAARAEREALRRHYDEAGPEHNLLALLDLYDERRAAAESERDEARAERDARPDISAEDARAFMMFKPVPARDSREGPVMHALRAHAAKAVKP